MSVRFLSIRTWSAEIDDSSPCSSILLEQRFKHVAEKAERPDNHKEEDDDRNRRRTKIDELGSGSILNRSCKPHNQPE